MPRDSPPVATVVAVEPPSVDGVVRVAVATRPRAAVVLHGDGAQASATLLDFLLEPTQVRVCSRASRCSIGSMPSWKRRG
jgi:hypothetical protein